MQPLELLTSDHPPLPVSHSIPAIAVTPSISPAKVHDMIESRPVLDLHQDLHDEVYAISLSLTKFVSFVSSVSFVSTVSFVSSLTPSLSQARDDSTPPLSLIEKPAIQDEVHPSL
jgi:hypothetical protein